MYLKKGNFVAQKGYFLIVAVLFIVIIGIMGTILSYIFVTRARISVTELQGLQAFYIAESGLEIGARLLTHPRLSGTPSRITCGGVNGNSATTDASLGSGTFTLTTFNSSPVYATTTLSSALTASSTTIALTSAASFTSEGRVMIDQELIDYAATSGNSLIAITRAVAGTTAASHVNGTPVAQYQCSIEATAGVPNLTNPSAQRDLQWQVQLQDGWAGGGNFNLARWNRATEESWNGTSVAISAALNSISMISYADGWGVGNSRNFIRWNGSTWTASTQSPSVNYLGVYCNSRNDCHAVGDRSGSSPVILDWNGTAWSLATPGGTVNRTTLNCVHCSASNNCWAVGDNAGGSIFYNWNGSSWTGVSNTLSAYTYRSVFCNATNDCWAVGANATFARKTGATWANFATGLPSAQYNSVYCVSSSDCWAVGNINSARDLMVHWNGSSWSRDASNPTPAANLNSVACINSDDCWAVGDASTFIHWDGSSWTRVAAGGSFPSVTLRTISLIGPLNQPQSAWTQVFR